MMCAMLCRDLLRTGMTGQKVEHRTNRRSRIVAAHHTMHACLPQRCTSWNNDLSSTPNSHKQNDFPDMKDNRQTLEIMKGDC
mmetsp:Transcript_4833/g.10238  ORF Transcript_4833/g.10238 Transcript_4833/m.10238 type:complete len:82 (+) Transcript_4833:380-625(+)